MAAVDIMQMDGTSDQKKVIHPFFVKPKMCPTTTEHETQGASSKSAQSREESQLDATALLEEPQIYSPVNNGLPTSTSSATQIPLEKTYPRRPSDQPLLNSRNNKSTHKTTKKQTSNRKHNNERTVSSESVEGAVMPSKRSLPVVGDASTPPKRQRRTPPFSASKEKIEAESDEVQATLTAPYPATFFASEATEATVAEPVVDDPMDIDHGGVPEAVESAGRPSNVAKEDDGPDFGGDGPAGQQTAQPKKIVYFNIASGTLGSPPPKKNNKATEQPKKRGRPKKVKSKIVVIQYASEEEPNVHFGQRIDAVLSGEEIIPYDLSILDKVPGSSKANAASKKPFDLVGQHKPTVAKAQAVQMPAKAKPAKAVSTGAKSTHPFFLGKAAVKADSKDSAATPKRASPKMGSPKQEKTRDSPLRLSPPKLPKFRSAPRGRGTTPKTGNSTLLFTSNKTQKVPGALEAEWPCSELVHVRGAMDDMPIIDNNTAFLGYKTDKKAKYASTTLGGDEEIINHIMSQLRLPEISASIRGNDSEHTEPPAQHLRIPNRFFETGQKLQHRILPQIKSSVQAAGRGGESEDELAMDSANIYPHHAVSKVYNMITESLSSFDRGESCTQTWAAKYAPQTAAEVLQSGREALILKEWLQTQTAASVDVGSTRKSPPRKRKSEAPVAKKRKAKKLDGFVISDGEEDNEMEEAEDFDSTPQNSQGGLKTVIRRGDVHAKESGESKLHNAVVISGPNGCGKTSAVYAVAKELGFEVFEINSSTRRSGKDILEKVGDMTKNHLVQQKRRSSNDNDEDFKKASDALEKDLKSGRQGTMNSFFKAAPQKKIETPKPKKAAKKVSKAEPESKKSKVQQKQSLILLEEVDVLFEEDKLFWLTVLELIATSKRPIIMTCNDESIVLPQLAACPLHAIIRFSPPPVDTAVDYLLLVAANEGHHIFRNAIEMLYKETKFDLRKSLTELEAWCQMCIGDRKGGYDWFISRWPTGQDLDPHGRKLRVVSQGSYRRGQGWLGHDYINGRATSLDKEMELLKEAWEGWQIDASDWHESLKIEQMPSFTQTGERNSSAGDLEYFEDFLLDMSTSDIVSKSWFGLDNDTNLDTTLPSPPSKRAEDNQLGHYFLQADVAQPQSALQRDISFCIRSLAKSNLNNNTMFLEKLPQLTEKRVQNFIVSRTTAPPSNTTRADFALAFDPIATTSPTSSTVYTLEPTQLDRTTAIIAEDIAPYVRHIVNYDQELAEERRKKSNLLVGGGGKRMRMTRTAMASLEGGMRKSTRRERWFGEGVSANAVEKTGGDWKGAVKEALERRREELMVQK